MVEGDAGELMLEKRIAEAVQGGASKGVGLRRTLGDHRHDFLKQDALQPRAHFRMLQALAHRFNSTRCGVGHQRGVSTVENPDFSQVIRGEISREGDGGMNEKPAGSSAGLNTPKRERFSTQ